MNAFSVAYINASSTPHVLLSINDPIKTLHESVSLYKCVVLRMAVCGASATERPFGTIL